VVVVHLTSSERARVGPSRLYLPLFKEEAIELVWDKKLMANKRLDVSFMVVGYMQHLIMDYY